MSVECGKERREAIYGKVAPGADMQRECTRCGGPPAIFTRSMMACVHCLERYLVGSSIRSVLRTKIKVKNGQRGWVAFSGGMYSTALLHTLVGIRGCFNNSSFFDNGVIAVHIDESGAFGSISSQKRRSLNTKIIRSARKIGVPIVVVPLEYALTPSRASTYTSPVVFSAPNHVRPYHQGLYDIEVGWADAKARGVLRGKIAQRQADQTFKDRQKPQVVKSQSGCGGSDTGGGRCGNGGSGGCGGNGGSGGGECGKKETKQSSTSTTASVIITNNPTASTSKSDECCQSNETCTHNTTQSDENPSKHTGTSVCAGNVHARGNKNATDVPKMSKKKLAKLQRKKEAMLQQAVWDARVPNHKHFYAVLYPLPASRKCVQERKCTEAQSVNTPSETTNNPTKSKLSEGTEPSTETHTHPLTTKLRQCFVGLKSASLREELLSYLRWRVISDVVSALTAYASSKSADKEHKSTQSPPPKDQTSKLSYPLLKESHQAVFACLKRTFCLESLEGMGVHLVDYSCTHTRNDSQDVSSVTHAPTSTASEGNNVSDNGSPVSSNVVAGGDKELSIGSLVRTMFTRFSSPYERDINSRRTRPTISIRPDVYVGDTKTSLAVRSLELTIRGRGEHCAVSCLPTETLLCADGRRKVRVCRLYGSVFSKEVAYLTRCIQYQWSQLNAGTPTPSTPITHSVMEDIITSQFTHPAQLLGPSVAKNAGKGNCKVPWMRAESGYKSLTRSLLGTLETMFESSASNVVNTSQKLKAHPVTAVFEAPEEPFVPSKTSEPTTKSEQSNQVQGDLENKSQPDDHKPRALCVVCLRGVVTSSEEHSRVYGHGSSHMLDVSKGENHGGGDAIEAENMIKRWMAAKLCTFMNWNTALDHEKKQLVPGMDICYACMGLCSKIDAMKPDS